MIRSRTGDHFIPFNLSSVIRHRVAKESYKSATIREVTPKRNIVPSYLAWSDNQKSRILNQVEYYWNTHIVIDNI